MRIFFFIILLLTVQSYATKKYTKKRLLPEGIKSATEEKYAVVNNQKNLLLKKEMVFKNGHIKHSKTVDAAGNLVQETEKRKWFVVETYPDKEPYYCKTRWMTKQRERISCYTKKQYKQNESIYHYNKDGTIDKIVDNFTTFHTRQYYYANRELCKIVTRDKNDQLIDEVLVNCMAKDEKGACLKEIRISTKTNYTEEILISPVYD